jgi:hypothetical protein
MPENSRWGVADVQWQIVDVSRSMSCDYLLYQVARDSGRHGRLRT